MLGIKSRNVWVIAIETTNMTGTIGFKEEMKDRLEMERRIAVMRFMWIPGESPVKVPAIMPTISATMSSRIISGQQIYNLFSITDFNYYLPL